MSARSRAGRLIGDGKYELLSQIASGAMGTVWLARHVALDRMVAVKMLNMVTGANSAARQRFLAEARSASLLRHTNSVRILDYAAEDDDCWLVMEFVEGRNLADILTEQSPLSSRRAISIAAQVLAAVAEAHEYALVHRDLKPANIMLVPWIDDDGDETEHVKVLDFGIATIARAAPDDADADVAGTPEYMSPEQAQGLNVDPRSDVYAVGVLLYQMAVGEVPFQADTALETMLAHVNNAPTPPRNLNPSISPGLEALLLRALAKAPEQRFQSARSMRTALLELPEAAGLRSDSSPKMKSTRASRPLTSPGMPRPSHPLSAATGVAAAVPAAPTATPVAPVTAAPAAPAETRSPRRAWLWAALALLLIGGGVAVAFALSGPEPSPPQREQALALQPIEVPPPVQIAAVEDVAAVAEATTPDAAPADAADAMVAQAIADTADAGPDAPIEVAEAVAVPVAPTVVATRDDKPVRKAVAEARPPGRERPAPKPDAVARRDAPKPPAPAPSDRLATVDAPSAPKPKPGPDAGGASSSDAANAPTQPAVIAAEAPARPQHDVSRPALDARVAVRELVVKGSLPRSSVQRALDATVPALEECYRAAAKAAGHDSAGKLDASVVIDIDGQATDVRVAAFGLPGFTACARQALSRARSRDRPDTGSVMATLNLAITPRPPRTSSESPP